MFLNISLYIYTAPFANKVEEITISANCSIFNFKIPQNNSLKIKFYKKELPKSIQNKMEQITISANCSIFNTEKNYRNSSRITKISIE